MPPFRSLRVVGRETRTVSAEADAPRNLSALAVVPAIGMSGSMRRGAGEDGTADTLRFGDSAPIVYRTRPPGGALQDGNHCFSVHRTWFSTEVDFSSCDVRFGSRLCKNYFRGPSAQH